MSTQKLRIQAESLYTKEEACQSLECSEWLIDCLVSLFGLRRLGGKRAHYFGADLITALRRHAIHDLVDAECEVRKSRSKDELLKLKREREKGRVNAAREKV